MAGILYPHNEEAYQSAAAMPAVYGKAAKFPEEIIKAPAALPGIRRDSRGKPGPGGKSPAAGGRAIVQAAPRQIS